MLLRLLRRELAARRRSPNSETGDSVRVGRDINEEDLTLPSLSPGSLSKNKDCRRESWDCERILLIWPACDRGVGHSFGLLDLVDEVLRSPCARSNSAARRACAKDDGPSNDPVKNPSSCAGVVCEMTSGNLRSLSHRLIDTVLNNYREFHTNTLRVLNNSSVAKNSIDFRLGCSLAVCTQQCKSLLLIQSVRAW